jgi:Holliday junction resolvasome RuvABC endonuclease subunit
MNKILACDPSLTAFGWVVMEGQNIVESGCIKTTPTNKKQNIRKGDDRCRRITEINSVLIDLIKKHDIKYIVSEQPHGSQSAVSAIMIGVVLGIVQTIADCYGIGVEWYSEGDCKENLLGKRSAGKDETITVVKRYYRYRISGYKYIDEAVCDALAVYHYGMRFSSVVKFSAGVD